MYSKYIKHYYYTYFNKKNNKEQHFDTQAFLSM